jgi:hypothetical protein
MVYFVAFLVLQYVHRRYAFCCAAIFMLHCNNGQTSIDRCSIVFYSGILWVFVSFQAFNRLFLLILGQIA